MASRQPMPKCPHCGYAIYTCISRHPYPRCPPACKGYRHHRDGKHRCGPQAGSTYAEVERAAR